MEKLGVVVATKAHGSARSFALGNETGSRRGRWRRRWTGIAFFALYRLHSHRGSHPPIFACALVVAAPNVVLPLESWSFFLSSKLCPHRVSDNGKIQTPTRREQRYCEQGWGVSPKRIASATQRQSNQYNQEAWEEDAVRSFFSFMIYKAGG